MCCHVGISIVREPKLREEKCLSQGHTAGVSLSLNLNPAPGTQRHLLFLPPWLLSRSTDNGAWVSAASKAVSSWGFLSTHLVGDCLHGDLVALFRLDLSSDEALLLIFDPAGPLDVIGLAHGFEPLLFGRCQEGHRVHIVPTFTFVSTRHCGLAEGGARRNQGWEPGLPEVL